MPTEVSVKLYGLSELKDVSGRGYLRAVESLRDSAEPESAADDEHVIGLLLKAGFEDPIVSVDASCTQGSGASFTCSRVDVRKMLAYLEDPTSEGTDCHYPDGKVPAIAGYVKDAILSCPEVFASIDRIERAYVHEGTCRVEVTEARDAEGNDLPDDVVDAIREAIDTVRRDFCRWIHKLQRSYNDDATDETRIVEEADELGRLFTERGRLAGYTSRDNFELVI